MLRRRSRRVRALCPVGRVRSGRDPVGPPAVRTSGWPLNNPCTEPGRMSTGAGSFPASLCCRWLVAHLQPDPLLPRRPLRRPARSRARPVRARRPREAPDPHATTRQSAGRRSASAGGRRRCTMGGHPGAERGERSRLQELCHDETEAGIHAMMATAVQAAPGPAGRVEPTCLSPAMSTVTAARRSCPPRASVAPTYCAADTAGHRPRCTEVSLESTSRPA